MAYGGKDIAALNKELGYKAGTEFEPSDNWGFAQGDLLFEFQHDWGKHTIIIPAAKLRGIIKPQFLCEMDDFRAE
ncbi:hypothetical protein [Kingella sp. (in: b-proteobacteria)]|uniref:hypothetical protein n=1 Tax=Kingella sp. (in: b-proteobacteria) TaxID=2020713 RepID=UPI0026DCA9BE|nr:hypothetical protein [Kingella sp. (in: b-proteobacteria)]MDO4656239.1 hypothetical protein [Kingella sp. (in: b-proteobacteria)]